MDSKVLDRYLGLRVAGRSILAKGVQLMPEFKAALEKLQEGDPDLAEAFLKKVEKAIFGDQDMTPAAPFSGGEGKIQLPSWFHALGTAKRNAIIFLYKEGRVLMSSLHYVRGDSKYASYYSREFEKWGKKLRTLEIASQAGDEDTIIKKDGFVIIPMPGVAKKEIEGALEALEEAASKIRAKFPQVLYGNVYLTTHLSTKTAAHYVSEKDEVALSVRARKRFSDVYTLIHEFGHRFDHKFFKDKTLRDLFWKLSTQKDFEMVNFDKTLRRQVAEECLAIAKARKEGARMPILSELAMLWLKTQYTPGWNIKKFNSEYLLGKLADDKYISELMGTEDYKISTGKLLHGPISVTPYGATKPSENFAEAFAHYVLGMPMAEEFVEILSKA